MSDFPRLAELGITDPDLITGYEINSINQIDVLRIAQKRERGSLLPTRRRWEFPRVQQGLPDKQRGTYLVTSPLLREIEAELDRLLADQQHLETTIESLQDELSALESEVAMRIHHIRDALARLGER